MRIGSDEPSCCHDLLNHSVSRGLPALTEYLWSQMSGRIESAGAGLKPAGVLTERNRASFAGLLRLDDVHIHLFLHL